MIEVRERVRSFVRGHRKLLVVCVVYAALAVLGNAFIPARGIPVLLPVYEIEAVSGSHTASLLNLPVGQPGAIQAPIPVDVDGDLIPDVLVSVNLIDAEGIIQNPPDLGDVLAPNVQIDRALEGIPLGKSSPPLRITVKLTVTDLLGSQPDTVLRFGYDTATGGSIPGSFNAVAGGLESFFNPLEAVIDTKGAMRTADSVFVWYEGPLDVIASLEQGAFAADATLSYKPFPDAVRVTYASDDEGQHFTYAHGIGNEVHLKYGTDVNGSNVHYIPGELPEVDLTTSLALRDGVDTLDLTARVERLPRSISLDIASGDDGGSVDYNASADGRLPDVGLIARSASPGQKPLNARVDIEDLPQRMHGEWSMPAGGPVEALFESSGQGIGAIEAHVSDFDGSSALLQPYVPEQQQFVNMQTAKGADGASERIISGRLERIRRAEAAFQPDGTFDGSLEIGDGERPLLAHVFLDDSAAAGPLIEATSTVSPLPDLVEVAFRPGTEGSATEPMRFTYEASESVDVDASARVIEAGTPASAACGSPGTICAALKARHVPTSIEARVLNFPNAGAEESRIEVDAIPRAGGAKPDLFADATIGQDDGVPLIAHAEVLGVPPFLRVRAVEGADQTVERAEFHACERDFEAGVCAPDTKVPVGALQFSLRNFLVRPANLPPAYAATPNFAVVTARGRQETTDVVDFEAVGRVESIAELTYLNKGGFAARSEIGGGKDLSVKLDVADVDLQGDDPANGRIDLLGEALVRPLPATFEFCLNRPGQDVVTTPTDPLLAACQEADPFDLGASLDRTPLSFHYDAATGFDVFTKAMMRLKGLDAASVEDDHTVRGRLDVQNLPLTFTGHFLTPEPDTAGPIRARYDTNPPGVAQINVDFAAEVTDADLVCMDPRVPAGENEALCIRGRVENIPTRVDMFYDPALTTDNLLVDTDGALPMNFKNLEFSSVRRADDGTADILIATGQVLGLPKTVTGSLDLPATDDDAPSVEVVASPPLGTVDLLVRNFIAPDPVPFGAPAQRAGLAAPTQSVEFFQRGDAFKAEAHIGDVKSFAYRTVRDADGKPLDTKVVRLDFGTNQVIRAYADIQEDPTSRVIGDVTLEDVPAGLSLCFRGERTPGAADPGPGEETFCDGANASFPIDDDEGAFQFKGTPETPADSPLALHAFVRAQTGGGGDILAGKIDITNIPFVVQGTFPSGAGKGDLDVGGYASDETTPDGIDRIDVELASFDLADDGYGTDRGFEPQTNTSPPFPAPATPNQHLSAVLRDADFNVRGRLGPQSQLQRVRMNEKPCPAPPNDPPDYPHFPAGDGMSTYTCVRVDLAQQGEGPDQLDLHAHVEKAGDVIAVHDAGITDIPAWVQMTLAETAVLNDDADKTLRRPCGSAAVEPDDATDCMPPLVRFDQPANTSLFGVAEIGRATDLAQVAGIDPRETLADLDALPATWAIGDRGVRAKVVSFGEDNDARTAARVGVHLPIPQSLTVDQLQKWTGQDKSGTDEYWQASDTRFRYVVRDSNGNPVASLGELSAMIHSESDGNQILLSRPCATKPVDRDSLDDCDDFAQGITIPGEVGLGLYTRNHTGHGRDFIQVDGRISTPLDIGARMLGGGPKPAVGRLEAEILNVPASNDPAAPAFRLRTEMLGEGEAPPTGGGGDGGGDEGGEDECTVFLCAVVEARIKNVYASFDFSPTGTPARRVEAVVHQDGATNQGVEVKSYDAVVGGSLTPVSADAAVEVDPINVFLHAGLPLIGGADFALISELHAGVDINAEHLRVRHNTLHIKALSEGGDSVLGPIDYYIYLMHGEAYALFVKLFGVDFLPPSTPPPLGSPVQLVFISCDPGDLFDELTSLGDNDLDLPDGNERNVVMWPFLDPRIHFSGAFGFLGDIGRILAGPFFCFTDADSLTLMEDGPPGPAGDHPGDPVGVARTGHPVPDAADLSEPPDAPPPPPVPTGQPDVTVGGSIALCGLHNFDDLTVNGTISVATAASNADSTGTGRPDCPSGEEGALTIVADDVTVAGAIRADGISTATTSAPAGNGGAGHRGAGGAGSTGAGGGTYGNGSAEPKTEAGSKAGAAKGGGVIVVHADDLDVTSSGEITAEGDDGANETGGACETPDGPDDGDEPDAPNTGQPGHGGASGGGIVIVATSLDNEGTIAAHGGDGGDGRMGGGGGGGGGAVKIVSPLRTGSGDYEVDGGEGGNNLCPGDASPAADGSDGDDGTLKFNDEPQSRPEPTLERFWFRDESGDQLDVPFSSAAKGGGTTGYQVVLCGRQISTETVASAPDGVSLNELFDMPDFAAEVGRPCGADSFFSELPVLGREQVDASRVTYDPPGTVTTIKADEEGMGNGYWGLWTVIFKPATAGNDCLDGVPPDFFTPDSVDCTIETLPERPELVVGVDNTDPLVEVTDPAPNPSGDDFLTNQLVIRLAFDAFDQADLSGIAAVQCANGGQAFVSCTPGGTDWPLAAGDGAKTIVVRVTDAAGNRSEAEIDGRLDTTVPDHPTVTVSAADGSNGWHQTPPSITISGFSDPGGSGPSATPFAYRFDDGEERTCDADPCQVDQALIDALLTGQHTLHYTAIDAATNRRFDDEDPDTVSPMATRVIKLDGKDPQSALLTVPLAVDGANGWFAQLPWAAISAIDQPGGSGLVGPGVGIFVDVDSGGFLAYTGPFRLTPGEHSVCWRVVDVAGNVDDKPSNCRTFKVDDDDPTVSIDAAPAAPDGSGGWYVSVPTIGVTASDGGSGVNQAFDADLSDLCGAVPPPVAPAPTPSGVCVSVDGGPFAPDTESFTLPEGLHDVRAFAVDVAGRRSPISTGAFMIDLSDPVAAARTITPEPARAEWWRAEPRVVLRAVDGDQNAGLARIEYSLDGAGYQLYTGPFAVPAGVHSVDYRAVDASGRVAASRRLVLPIDIMPPAVKATSPQPAIWSKLLGPAKAKLRWEVSDDRSDTLRIFVIVYDELGFAVRRIDGGAVTVTPGTTKSGFTYWDGTDQSLVGFVGVGIYHYRVIAVDEAGNTAQSGESNPLQIKLL